MRLYLLPSRFSLYCLDAKAALPVSALESDFMYVFRSADELSILLPEHCDAPGEVVEKNWVGLKVKGPLAFGEIGILAELSKVLAECEVSLLAVSSYLTDYLFIQENKLEIAEQALLAAGHRITRVDSLQSDVKN
jgi:hypothetical protein